MSNRLAVTLAAFAGIFALSGVGAAESPYYKNVSDIEVETGVKGTTYDKGPVNYFGGLSGKSDCSCACSGSVATTATAPVTSVAASSTVVVPAPAPVVAASPSATNEASPRVKYILDGKPVYEDATPSASPAPAAPAVNATPAAPVTPAATTAPVIPAPEKAKSTSMNADPEKIDMAVHQLGTSAWRDAQALLLASGRAAVPDLIDALNNSDPAYNLGGHTKSDAGRLPRQRTIAEVSAELLAEIVSDHSNYQGDVPGADQNAWRDWWSKNAGSIVFAGDVQNKPAEGAAGNVAVVCER